VFCRWGIIFALFVPYFCDIPRVAVTHIWGVPFTGKSVAYVIGLQVNVWLSLYTLEQHSLICSMLATFFVHRELAQQAFSINFDF